MVYEGVSYVVAVEMSFDMYLFHSLITVCKTRKGAVKQCNVQGGGGVSATLPMAWLKL